LSHSLIPHHPALRDSFSRPSGFHFDPPCCCGSKDYYGKGVFGREDFRRLRDLLAQISGRFILSTNNVPEIIVLIKESGQPTIKGAEISQ
jgi:hypothetical protein